MENIIIGISGASGVVYARRLLQVLQEKPLYVHLSVSEAALEVIRQELGLAFSVENFDVGAFVGTQSNNIWYYPVTKVDAPMSSGTFPAKGMIIIPCSVNTIGCIAGGMSLNLIQRAAGVTLKEGRKLIIVPRESPLSSVHIESMLRLANAGACILPAMPGFYHAPKKIDDLVDFVVAKALDQLGIEHSLMVPKEGSWYATCRQRE